ncbi:MAG TPA: YhfC family glutamic-type intramembrane protease [Brevefilum sp.]
MNLLSLSIVIALLVIIGLPIAAGYWLKDKLDVSWRTITFGVLGYFIVQVLVSLIFSGLTSVIPGWDAAAAGDNFRTSQILTNVFLGVIIGVLVRWGGMKFLKIENLEDAYGLGVGYAGAESIMLVGLPLLMTFITMVSNINIDSQTSTLEPEMIAQIEELWALEFFIPLATALERITAFIMHISVTLLIFQVFKRNQPAWLGAAVCLEMLINGLVVGLSEAGLHYGWVILIGVLLMIGNLVIIYRLHGFDIDITKSVRTKEDA